MQRKTISLPVGLPVLWAAAALLALVVSSTAGAFDHSHQRYGALLKAHVAKGAVDYRALKANPRALNGYLDELASVSKQQFQKWSREEQLAYYFNLYNAATLKLIVDHYPVSSIKDIGGWLKGPWDQKVVRLFGDTITLNNLEHDILRKQYDEPRLHVALVCAARSCPPLRSETYTAQELDKQLDDQARVFLASPAGLRLDRRTATLHLSAIFDWYGDDFVGTFTPKSGFSGLKPVEAAVAHFCAGYLSDSDRLFLRRGGYSIAYLNYDWSLNDASAK